MWPKILLELLPHFARLAPMADKYLATRGAGEKAQAAVFAALAEDVRGEVGQVSQEHTRLSLQLQEQSTQLAEVAAEVASTRMVVESVEVRVVKLEKMAGAARALLVLLVVLAALSAGTLILLAVLLVKK